MLTSLKSLFFLAVALLSGCGTRCIVPNRAEVAAYSTSETEVESPEFEKLLVAVRETVDCLIENSKNTCGFDLNAFHLNKDIKAAVYLGGSKIERILRRDTGNGEEVTVEFPWAPDGSGFGVLVFRWESEKFVAKLATVALP